MIMTNPEAEAMLARHDLSSLRLGTFCAEPVSAAVSQSVLHTSKHGGRAHTHTHAAHDWLGSRHEARCHRP